MRWASNFTASDLISSVLFGLGSGLVFGLGCYIEPAEPASFRFQCAADSDCDDAEVCADGLCQQRCGGADDSPCASTAPICLNGYCSSICPLADDPCPAPQTCMGLSASDGDDAESSGVCTVACEDDDGCPDGQVCFAEFGLCVATCMTVDDCQSGEECAAGFCIPASSGGGFP